MTHYLRWIVLQTILGAGGFAFYLTGNAGMPFHGLSLPFIGVILTLFGAGLVLVLLKKFDDVRWISTRILYFGIFGTALGLIIMMSALQNGIPTDPELVRQVTSHLATGFILALSVTAAGLGTREWLKLNLRLLGGDKS